MTGFCPTKKAVRQKKTRTDFKQRELGHFISSAIVKCDLLTDHDKELFKIAYTEPNYGPLVQKAPGFAALRYAEPPGVSSQQSRFSKEKPSPKLSRVRNLCARSGKARAITQDYKLSRNYFKALSELGFVSGVKKV